MKRGNPPRYIRCSVCKTRSPKKWGFQERMAWLRRHYKLRHPLKFRGWFKKKRRKR